MLHLTPRCTSSHLDSFSSASHEYATAAAKEQNFEPLADDIEDNEVRPLLVGVAGELLFRP
jgi:hypothetical protein